MFKASKGKEILAVICGVLSVIVSIIAFTHPKLSMFPVGCMIAFSVLTQGVNMIVLTVKFWKRFLNFRGFLNQSSWMHIFSTGIVVLLSIVSLALIIIAGAKDKSSRRGTGMLYSTDFMAVWWLAMFLCIL